MGFKVYRIYTYKPKISDSILTFKLWGRLIRRSCRTARVGSYLSATLTVCEPHMAWTISRSLGLHGCVGRARRQGSEGPHTDLCCCCIASHCNLTPFQHSDHARPLFSQSHTQAVSCHIRPMVDLGYTFIVADFRYRFTCRSLIFATFSATGMGVGLYARRLIRDYIRYTKLHIYRLLQYSLANQRFNTRKLAGFRYWPYMPQH